MVDINKVYGLIGYRHKGNVADFAKQIGIHRTTLWRILNGNIDNSDKFLVGFKRYCDNNDLIFAEYFVSDEV